MRVGVDYRILASGRSASTRGMPRFTQQQLREVLRRDGDNEYLLFVAPEADAGLILPEISGAANVSVRAIPAALAVAGDDPSTLPDRAGRYLDWIDGQGIDLYHATTPFYLEQLVVPAFDVCPMVATLYDLIPLIFPAHYLLTAGDQASYLRAAGLVAGATRVLAISEAARVDGNLYLGVPRERIDVAYPIAEPFFRPLTVGVVDTILSGLNGGAPLPADFVMAVSHLHYTKNMETLLRAWSLVPERIRALAPLVITGHFEPHGTARVKDLGRRLGVDGQIVITGLVSDAELVALYNRARMVVHASRYEGFGLPVLEAMQCGTPVITSTTSSLPEVGGDAAALVDAHDAPALADAIVALWDAPDRRSEMSRLGLEQARKFSGSQLAEATLASYRRALGDCTAPAPDGSEVGRTTLRTIPHLTDGGATDGAQEQRSVNFNKLCEFEDLSDPALAALMSDMAPSPTSSSTGGPLGQWKAAMALRAFGHFGVLRPDARVLGAGAATYDVVFRVAGQVGQVFAVDEYVVDGVPSPMLVDPSAVAPIPVDADRLVVQHMDRRRLRFPDDTFDGVISPGSIGWRRSLTDVAAAAFEMGRVLRPGGVLSLTTEVVLCGPSGGGQQLSGSSLRFSPDDLGRYVIEASGLEPVDALSFDVSPLTLATPRDMSHAVGRLSRGAPSPDGPAAATASGTPRLLALSDGDVVGSVHLTLRKTDRYPHPANRWARPPTVPGSSTAEGAGQPSSADLASSSPGRPGVPAGDISDVEAAAERRMQWARQRHEEVPRVLTDVMAWQGDTDTLATDARLVVRAAGASLQRLVDRAGPSGDPPPAPLADELSALRERYEDLIYWLEANRRQMETVRISLADAQAHYLHVRDEVADALAHSAEALADCVETHRLVEGIGPLGLGVARRVEGLATRFPGVAAVTGRALRTRLAQRTRSALRRAPGRMPT